MLVILRRFRYSPSVILFCLAVLFSVMIPSSAESQRLESKRLDVLLTRHGWIRIGLTESTGKAQISIPSGARISADGKTFECVGGTVALTGTRAAIQVNVPGQGTLSATDIIIAPNNAMAFGFNDRQYRGRARITARGRTMRVVNEVMIDDWLKGVLPAEIGSDAPLEALKAQAVAGRSEAIFRLARPPHEKDGYDFCTGVHCQAYKGISQETPQIREACDATLGYVLVANEDVVNAVYHNVCGGATAAAEDVWDGGPVAGISASFDTSQGGRPNLQTRAAAAAFIESDGRNCFCYPGNPDYAQYAKKYFRWKKTLSVQEAGRAAGVGTLTDIAVVERRPSGRVRKLRVTGTAGSKIMEKELPIRRAFDLWSGLFILQSNRGSDGRLQGITFVGAGNGHGVGLCQHGAREIARRGGTFDQILGHYYPEAGLRKVYRP